MWPLIQRPIAGIGVLIAQVLRAAHRDDLPSLQDQDPSGVFGDPSLPPLRVVVLGDSTVTAPGVVPVDAAWPRQLGLHLSDRFHVVVESVAVGGSKVGDVLRNQVVPAIEFGPDVAVISVGANDAMRGTAITRFEAEYRLMLDRLQESVTLIIAGGVGDLGTLVRLPTLARAIARVRGRAVNGAIRRAAWGRRGVVKTETWGAQWGGFERAPHDYFSADHFHASASGHGLFSGSVCAGVDTLLETPEGRAFIALRESPGSTT
jgi:lysophospholipase L1-like esterase